jgi:ADP-ribose pyrophosphatase
VERADGTRAVRDIAGHPGAVAIVALDDEGRVALVRQWRLPAGRALLEIPAGGLDVAADGTKEDPLLAAPRELEEETGLRARTWRPLAEFYTAPGFTDELMFLSLATELEPVADDGRLGPDEDERLILEWRPWREAVAAARNGEICDAKSIVGLLLLERMIERGEVVAGASGTITARYRLSLRDSARSIAKLVGRSLPMRILGVVLMITSVLPLSVGDYLGWIGLVLGAGMVTGFALVPLVWGQARTRPDHFGADITLRASAEGMSFTSERGSLDDPWSRYEWVRQDDAYAALQTLGGKTRLIPFAAFDDGQLATFRDLLERHVGSRATEPPPA